jgi:alkanesulfonate monooxygenase SsuD/methylene tetrahydromethanopterin reductase-like flavin-dependent oxidoreductase (luciferase family)
MQDHVGMVAQRPTRTGVALSAIVLPDRHPPQEFLADVAHAQDLGVRTVWTYDHLVWPPLEDGPWYGSVPLLAAAAMRAPRVRLGLQVATPNFRHPVPFAKELMTLDQISGGRLEVGLGAGVEGPDALVLGDPSRGRGERSNRFAEWLGLLDRLLRDPVTTVRGERFTAIDAHMLPGCAQRPRVPFTVAAAGPRALELVAQHGQAWVTYGPYGPQVREQDWFAALADQSGRLDEKLAAADRAPIDVSRIAQFALDVRWPFESAQRYLDTLGRLGELGFTEVTVHWCRPDGRGLPITALDSVASAHGL